MTGDALFAPKSIAVFGASPSIATFAGRAFGNLIAGGYIGRLLPISLRHDSVQGVRAYRDLEEHVDAAVIAVPAESVVPVIQRCADQQVRLAVVASAGFAEIGNAADQEAIRTIATESGMRVLGPNCLGFINAHERICATVTGALAGRSVAPGPIALVSESGGLGFASILARGIDAGVGFSIAISSGNEADLNAAELIECCVDDEHTRVVAALIEQIRDPETFKRAARRAQEAGKTIVVLKVGRTPAGARAARAHTAAIAGTDAVYNAVFDELGIVRVDDIDDLWQMAVLLARAQRANGRRTLAVSRSGGFSALLADHLSLQGLVLPQLEETTRNALVGALPDFVAPDNPIDLTGRAIPGVTEFTLLASVVQVADRADDVDIVVAGISAGAATTSTFDDWKPFIDAAASASKPVVMCWYGARGASQLQSTVRAGVPVFWSPSECARALARLPGAVSARPVGPAAEVPQPPAPAEERDLLPEESARMRELAARYELPMALEELVTSSQSAVESARGIGYPVALKAVDLIHKIDSGGVALGLNNDEEVVAAFAVIRDRVGALRVSVQEMVVGLAEILVGAHGDPDFGPVLVIGWGGTFAEIFGGASICLLPTTSQRVLEMVWGLPGSVLLTGVRGQPAADVTAIVDTAMKVAAIALSLGTELESLDINPLIVKRRGEGACVVDAKLLLAPANVRDTHGD